MFWATEYVKTSSALGYYAPQVFNPGVLGSVFGRIGSEEEARYQFDKFKPLPGESLEDAVARLRMHMQENQAPIENEAGLGSGLITLGSGLLGGIGGAALGSAAGGTLADFAPGADAHDISAFTGAVGGLAGATGASYLAGRTLNDAYTRRLS